MLPPESRKRVKQVRKAARVAEKTVQLVVAVIEAHPEALAVAVLVTMTTSRLSVTSPRRSVPQDARLKSHNLAVACPHSLVATKIVSNDYLLALSQV